MASPPKTVLLPIITQLATDYRCYKVAKTLKKFGYKPHILCDRPGQKLGPIWDEFHITSLTKHSHLHGFLKAFLIFNIKAVPYFWNKNTRAIIVEDYPALWTASFIGWLRNIPVIFDSHELSLETPGVRSGFWRFRFWRWWHDNGLNRVKKIIVVSPLFRLHLQTYLPAKKYLLLPNVPFREPVSDTKTPRPCPPPPADSPDCDKREKVKLVFIGYIRPDANLPNVIGAIRSMEQFSLTIIGGGPGLMSVREAVAKWGLQDRIKFTGPLPFEKIHPHLESAHIGIDVLNSANKSVDYTWANKSFEYIQKGLPVLMGATSGYRSLIKSHPVGVLADPSDKKSIQNGLIKLWKAYPHYTEQCRLAARKLCWEYYEKGLISFIESRQ